MCVSIIDDDPGNSGRLLMALQAASHTADDAGVPPTGIRFTLPWVVKANNG
jgi:hypothetical protein